MSRFRLFRRPQLRSSLRQLDFGLESLERREMLAGLVSVVRSGTTLFISGDASSNQVLIDMSQSNPNDRVQGLSGTTVNVSDSFISEGSLGLTRVSISMGDGNNDIEIKHLLANAWESLSGRGSNTIRLENSGGISAIFSDAALAGTTQDITLDDTGFDGSVSIISLDADTVVDVRDSQIKQFSFTGGGGDDSISLFSTQIGQKIPANNGKLTINTGDGAATVDVVSTGLGPGNASIHGPVTITVGNGPGTDQGPQIKVQDVRIRRSPLKITTNTTHIVEVRNVDMLTGLNYVSGGSVSPLTLSFVSIDGSLTATANGGRSGLTVQASQISKNITVKANNTTSPGSDALQASLFGLSGTNVGGNVNVDVRMAGSQSGGTAFHSIGNSIVDGYVRLIAAGRAAKSQLMVHNSTIKKTLSHSGVDEGTNTVTIGATQAVGQVLLSHFEATSEVTINNSTRLGGNLTIKKGSRDQSSDTLTIEGGAQVNGLTKVSHFDGDSDTVIKEGAILAKPVAIRNGHGTDLFELDDAEIRGNLRIQNFTGNSVTSITDSDITGSLTLDNSGRTREGGIERGFDVLGIFDTDIRTAINVKHGSGGSQSNITGGTTRRINFSALQGDDDLRVNDMTVNGAVTITTGTGSRAIQNQIGGTDEDFVSFDRAGDPETSEYNGLVLIRTFGGNDSVRLGGTLFASNSANFNGPVIVIGGEGDQDEFIEGLHATFRFEPRLVQMEV